MVVARPAVDLLLERFEEALALDQLGRHLLPLAGVEPVPGNDPVVPAPDLVQVLPDLLRLLVGVVLPEALELDLLGELRPALLDDLGVLLGREPAEAGDQALPLPIVEVGEAEEVAAAP